MKGETNQGESNKFASVVFLMKGHHPSFCASRISFLRSSLTRPSQLLSLLTHSLCCVVLIPRKALGKFFGVWRVDEGYKPRVVRDGTILEQWLHKVSRDAVLWGDADIHTAASIDHAWCSRSTGIFACCCCAWLMNVLHRQNDFRPSIQCLQPVKQIVKTIMIKSEAIVFIGS